MKGFRDLRRRVVWCTALPPAGGSAAHQQAVPQMPHNTDSISAMAQEAP